MDVETLELSSEVAFNWLWKHCDLVTSPEVLSVVFAAAMPFVTWAWPIFLSTITIQNSETSGT